MKLVEIISANREKFTKILETKSVLSLSKQLSVPEPTLRSTLLRQGFKLKNCSESNRLRWANRNKRIRQEAKMNPEFEKEIKNQIAADKQALKEKQRFVDEKRKEIKKQTDEKLAPLRKEIKNLHNQIRQKETALKVLD